MAQNKIVLKWLVEREKHATFFIGISQKCDIMVDWGDGQIEVFECDKFNSSHPRFNEYSRACYTFDENQMNEISHSYDSDGGFQVTILVENGDFISFANDQQNHDKWVELDITSAPDLVELSCQFSSLKNLDLSKNTVLQFLYINFCSELSELDVSHNIALKKLICWSCDINDLYLGQNIDLEELDCHHNKLTNLDLGKNLQLKDIKCGDNLFNELDLSNNIDLEELDVSGVHTQRMLEKLDISKNVALKKLYCPHQKLQKIDVSKNIALETLCCWDNQLEELDVSKNVNLKFLACEENKLTSLNVTNNIELSSLRCGNNQLKTLDLSKSVNLIQIDCRGNEFKSLLELFTEIKYFF
ncbi:MAG: hypothetical protein FWH18_09350 [Marinilabiliaceae bacterium]|nr:hypothetical protein [Marinilabiliaceae bacterium]